MSVGPVSRCQALLFLLHMTVEQRDLGKSGISTRIGRQGQAMQGLEDHVNRVGLYPKSKGKQRSVVLKFVS